jgi:hypothetical protein
MRHKQRLKSDLIDLLRQHAIDSYTNTSAHALAEMLLKQVEDIAKQNKYNL